MTRFNALDEMNPQRLWTTMPDRGVCSPLQVKISHADSTEETFSTPLGQLVELRRAFVQANAYSISGPDG